MERQAILTTWVLALLLTTASFILWCGGVPQVKTWFSLLPALALVTNLFAIVASLYLLDRKAKLAVTVVPSSLVATLWCLAIAIGA